mmetsp:Transcript_60728/g.190866  ORF Transcript_60728/g.190866 Transcript_60728/m.190866 type:complete len:300 (-) Transcript_60728:1-900(-)
MTAGTTGAEVNGAKSSGSVVAVSGSVNTTRGYLTPSGAKKYFSSARSASEVLARISSVGKAWIRIRHPPSTSLGAEMPARPTARRCSSVHTGHKRPRTSNSCSTGTAASFSSASACPTKCQSSSGGPVALASEASAVARARKAAALATWHFRLDPVAPKYSTALNAGMDADCCTWCVRSTRNSNERSSPHHVPSSPLPEYTSCENQSSAPKIGNPASSSSRSEKSNAKGLVYWCGAPGSGDLAPLAAAMAATVAAPRRQVVPRSWYPLWKATKPSLRDRILTESHMARFAMSQSMPLSL